LAIAGALEQIAEQAYEIAQALAPKLLEHENHRGTACVTCFAA
jgi:hypothetical protein